MVALIDSDSIPYIVGWNLKDNLDPGAIRASCDSIVDMTLTLVGADQYIGTFSSEKNFRHRIYKYAPYKGTRKEKPDWYVIAEPICKQHLIQKWGFMTPEDMEADDVLSLAAEWYRKEGVPYIICSPDKDLNQVPGLHFNYSKTTTISAGQVESIGIVNITEEEAFYNLCLQYLMGDDTDNVHGIPGVGIVKAKAILKEVEPVEYLITIRNAYMKYFGVYYGNEIFQQTRDTVQLLSSKHTLAHAINHDFHYKLLLNVKPYSHIPVSGYDLLQQD